MAERKASNDFGIVFRPEHWSSLERSRTFVGRPFPNDHDLHRGAKAVADHMGKFEILAGLANRLAQDLYLDNAELQARGHTPAIRPRSTRPSLKP